MSELNERVAVLETHFKYIRDDLTEIKTALRGLSDTPTRRDLWSWKLQWTGICVAAVALIVGGIIGGLDYIKPAPSQPVPIVFQAPAAVQH